MLYIGKPAIKNTQALYWEYIVLVRQKIKKQNHELWIEFGDVHSTLSSLRN